MKRKIKSKRKTPSILYLVLTLVFVLFIAFSFKSPQPKQITCANTISCKTAPHFEAETNAVGVFNNQSVVAPNIYISKNEVVNPVLGASTSQGEKVIKVNLATQILTAFEGNDVYFKTFISSGLWGKTPEGEYTIWSKFRATRMSGGTGADYYDLPNVPYVMFFSNDEVPGSAGFSLHGAYWHNNFGHAMSHGCVNMRTIDAQKIFDWADGPLDGKPGTKVIVYSNPPIQQ